MAPLLRYHLSVADLPGKRLQVEIEIPESVEGPVLLSLPTWVPGSYLIREYAGHVTGVRAQANGADLPVRKIDKTTWRVFREGNAACTVRYQVFAGELTVRTSDITHEHAFVHPPSVFMGLADRENGPLELRVTPPEGWKTHTALESTDDNLFVASSYDVLLDSPLELGPFDAHCFDVRDVAHSLVVAGRGNLDVDKLLGDMRRIVEAEADLFGELPYSHYLFILLLTNDRGGGLEHSNSCALAWPQLKFRPASNYRRFLTLVAHELFHVWNVKRIRPEAFRQYDYSKEQYTRLLWVFEGITSYYDELIPLRAGLYEAKHYLEMVAEHAVSEASRPGRHVQSLAQSSFDAWIKHYRPSPDALNTQVSYYERGQLVALLLDLFLRRNTKGECSLDDVMRALWSRYKQDVLLDEDDLADVIEQATGVDAGAFLDQHVHGTGALDYDEALSWVGLRARPRSSDEPRTWMGVALGSSNSGTVLSTVFHGGPAHAAGLMTGDEVVALDGHRVRGDLEQHIALYGPGETAAWTVFRRDRQLQGTVTFTENPTPPLEIVPVEQITAPQQEQFAAWTHGKWAFDPS